VCNHHFPFSPLQFTRSVQCCEVASAAGISYREHYATCHSSRREPAAAASASEWVGVLLASERASEHDSPLPTALNLAFVIVCGCKPSSHRTTRRPSPNPLPPPPLLAPIPRSWSFEPVQMQHVFHSVCKVSWNAKLELCVRTWGCVGVCGKRVHLKDTFSRSQHVWFSWQLNFTTCSLRWVLGPKSRNFNYVSQQLSRLVITIKRRVSESIK